MFFKAENRHFFFNFSKEKLFFSLGSCSNKLKFTRKVNKQLRKKN